MAKAKSAVKTIVKTGINKPSPLSFEIFKLLNQGFTPLAIAKSPRLNIDHVRMVKKATDSPTKLRAKFMDRLHKEEMEQQAKLRRVADVPGFGIIAVTPEEDEAMNKLANDIQIGGTHYKEQTLQPWDAIAAWDCGFLDGNVIKYVVRYRSKGGVEDLKKARHYLDKLIELEGLK